MNRRTWIASVGATLFLARLRNHTVTAAARSVDFSNDTVWNELVTAGFATTARTTPFHPEVDGEPER